MSGPVETKVAAGSVTFLAAGWLVNFTVGLMPWLHAHLTAGDQRELVLMVAWLLGSLAAYWAPHTPRQVAQVTQLPPAGPPPGNVTVRQ